MRSPSHDMNHTPPGSGERNLPSVARDLSSLTRAGLKYSTIYADPPWRYSNVASRAAAANHYSTWETTGEFRTNFYYWAFGAHCRSTTRPAEAGCSNAVPYTVASPTGFGNSSNKSAPAPTSNSTVAWNSREPNGRSTETTSNAACFDL